MVPGQTFLLTQLELRVPESSRERGFAHRQECYCCKFWNLLRLEARCCVFSLDGIYHLAHLLLPA